MQPATTEWRLLNLPKLTNNNLNSPELYFIAYSDTDDVKRWPGCNPFRETEDGLELLAQQTLPATVGETLSMLGAAHPYLWDRANVLEVKLESGALESVTEAAVLNGKNAALVGSEVIQFIDAELIGEKRYRLSGLLRGRQGTEGYINEHKDGEKFILLEASKLKTIPQSLTLLRQEQSYKTVTFNLDPDDTASREFSYSGQDLQPLAPVHIKAKRIGDEVEVSWIRQSRSGNVWLDNVDVPLGEAFERYEVDVIKNGEVINTVTSGRPSVHIPFQAGLSLKVYQLSESIGRGYSGELTL